MPPQELDALHWSIKIFTEPQIHFDRDMLVKYNAEVKQQKADAMEAIEATVMEYMLDKQIKVKKGGDPMKTVVRSAPHFSNVLRMLGVEPPTKISPKTGKESYAFAKTDEGLKELLEHPDPRVQALVSTKLEISSNIEETRSQNYLEVAERGTWPVHLNMSGAHTHRFSGGKGAGGNPQNLKRGGTLRDAILPPPGKIFLVSDLSQIEARLTLWIGMQMEQANMEAESLEIMRNGGDIYGFFGSHIYGMEITKKTHPFERQVAKSAVLGLGFGMGAERFINYSRQYDILNMSKDEADRIKNIYRSMYTGVAQSWKVLNKVLLPALLDNLPLNFPTDAAPLCYTGRDPVMNGPAVFLPGGLTLKYPEIERGEHGDWSYLSGAKRTKTFGGSMLENICQAVAGVMLRTHIVELGKYDEDFIHCVTNTHDELLMLINDTDELQDYRRRKEAGEKLKPPVTPESEIVERIMTTVPAYLPGLPIGVEYEYGYRYGDAK
jgi:DNA polymerase